MTIRIVQGADPAYPPPAELADIITPPASAGVGAGQIHSRVKPPRAPATPWFNSVGQGARAPDSTQDYRSQVQHWLNGNPATPSAIRDYLEGGWRQDLRDLKTALDALRRAAAQGLPMPTDPAIGNPDRPSTGPNPGPPLPGDTLPPTDPSWSPRNQQPYGAPLPQPSQSPPYTIEQSAYQAAYWLAQRWPKDVQQQGLQAFVAARVADVLDQHWTAKYWDKLDAMPNEAVVSIPTNTIDPAWDTPPFNNPLRRRSIARYGINSAPYPLPPPGTGLPLPYPGFAGQVDDVWLWDGYHAALCANFAFSDPYDVSQMAPLFVDAKAIYSVQASSPPSRVQYTGYALPLLWHSSGVLADPGTPLPHFGRHYHWTTPIAPGGAAPYAGLMQRHFVVDARILAMIGATSSQTVDRLQMRLAPGAGLGRYYGTASEIHTQFSASQLDAYVAKAPVYDGDLSALPSAQVEADCAWHYITANLVPFRYYLEHRREHLCIRDSAWDLSRTPRRATLVSYTRKQLETFYRPTHSQTLYDVVARSGPYEAPDFSYAATHAQSLNMASYGAAAGDTFGGLIYRLPSGREIIVPYIVGRFDGRSWVGQIE